MKLVHLSIVSIIGCSIGMIILLGFAWQSLNHIDAKQDELSVIHRLQNRIDNFSAATGSLLLFHADNDLWDAFQVDAGLLQDQLRQFGTEHPDALKAARHIEQIIKLITSTRSEFDTTLKYLPDTTAAGPLDIPPRSRIIMNQVAGHGIALDSVLFHVLRERRQIIANEAKRIVVSLVLAALLFGMLCVIAFSLIHRRVSAPAHELSRTLKNIMNGNLSTRAVVHGDDELSDLTKTLNAMLDYREQTESELRTTMTQLNQALATREALINSLPANIALLDNAGNIIEVNNQWRSFGQHNNFAGNDFGVGTNYLAVCENASGKEASEGAVMAQGLSDVLLGKRETFSLEYPCHSPEQQRWFRVMVNPVVSEAGQREVSKAVVVMHVDITDRVLAEMETKRLAYEDPLTGLLSRTGFTQELSGILEHNEWQTDALLVMLDIIDLRDINDIHGYQTGDELLIKFANRLKKRLRISDLAGRLGGDDFAIYLSIKRGEDPEQRLNTVKSVFKEMFNVGGVDIQITAHLGYTRLAENPRSVQELIREAELAMFLNRSNTDTPWVAYTEKLDEATHQRIQLSTELSRALSGNQFELHFQPKVNLNDGRLIGCEALLRWHHPERGLIAPDIFIPIAEQSRLIVPIGDWILHDVCRRLREWRDNDLLVVRVAVNVSLVQFQTGDFVDKISAVLSEFDLDPADLTLEVTESVFDGESDTLRQQLLVLQKMGVRLSLDDFGTGYSSLLYLIKYPFDEIKIDQGFVRGILEYPYNRNIVSTVMNIAGTLGAEVIAEGIESEAIENELLRLGCQLGQGYYYSMPLADEDFRWLLKKQSYLPLSRVTDNGTS